MNNANSHERLDRALEEASVWRTRREADDFNRAEQAEFDAWLTADPLHREAFEMVNKTSDLLEEARGPAARRAMDEAHPALADALVECDDLLAAARGERNYGRARRWTAAIAASLLIAVVASVAVFRINVTGAKTYATDVGEQETVMLTDGSVVTLNTDTKLSAVLSSEERRILLESGEAYFDVAKDASRPFIVVVGNETVRAVGTTFNIRRRNDETRVTVLEGVVEVDSRVSRTPTNNLPAAQTPITLRAGGAVTVAPEATSTAQLSVAEIDRAAAWRSGMLHFDSVPLGEIISEIQYYTDKELILAGDNIAGLIAGGSFNTDNPSAYLRGLAAALPIKLIERDEVIILSYDETDQG